MADDDMSQELYTRNKDVKESKVKEKRDLYDAIGVEVDVKNLNYTVIVNKKERKLLRDCSFHLEPGEMCALMGPSGAGKSTLLDMIADRKKIGLWSGQILINQRPRSLLFNRNSAYVLQDDVHLASLTVKETIMYAAWTRMEEGTPLAERDERVAFLLDMMGIGHVQDSIVGDAMHKGISGGQLKRLSIAVEIVHLPNLIFLDEPTSGLDSSIALEVMASVRKLADQNRTCVSTIHQPSPEVFALFDRAVLLCDGRLVYSGPADEAVTHFTRPALGYKYDPDENPSEFIIDVCGALIHPEGQEFPRSSEELEKLFRESPYAKIADRKEIPPEMIEFDRRHATNKVTQFKMILHRSWTGIMRDKGDLRAAVAKNVIIGLLTGIVFSGQADISEPLFDEDTGLITADVSNICAMIFFVMMFCLMNNLQVIPSLCDRNAVYRRELASFGYCASPYWLVTCFVYLPLLVFTHTIFIVLLYTMCGFPQNAEYFLFFYFNLLMANLASYYFAQLLAAASGNAQLAFAIFPMTFLFLAMFAGFAVPVDSVPAMWTWAPWLSYARYVFEGNMVNEFEQYETGDEVLAMYDFEDFNKGDAIWIVLLNMFAIMLGTYWAMRPAESQLIRVDDDHVSAPSAGDKKGLEEGLLGAAAPGSEEPAFAAKSTYDVAWYRTNTGEITMSRGCRLVFRDLTYTVTSAYDGKSKSKLLNSVSGRAHPGEMCALMGASGAGKSTLLDVLAGRKTMGEMEGDVLFNGMPRTRSIMRGAAYVMQDNHHIGCFTVHQTLLYAANLRMAERYSAESKELRIKKIMDMLGLTEHENTVVGDENIRGLSGGQQKRLSIGVEIINLPDLIFLDEPTTGLDSAISYEVMAAVRNLANQNRTVICTIHQPSPRTYFLFDKLLLLAHGKVIYFGPARDVVSYFVTSPYAYKYVRGTNPADFVISVAGGFINGGNGKAVSGEELAAYYSKGDLFRLFMENIDTMVAMDKAAAPPPAEVHPDDELEFITSTQWQVKILLHRVFFKTLKERRPTVVSAMRYISL
jgi:ABC-type multidrug transport system ATPase subunit